MSVKWQELLEAFAFVNSAPVGENSARLSRASGRIQLDSTWTEIWADEGQGTPEGDEGTLNIPHKTELGLGRDLVLWFAEEIIPDRQEEIELFFEKRGAYGKFKALLTEEGLLHEWYDFEKRAEDQALKDWCAENGMTILEDDQTTL